MTDISCVPEIVCFLTPQIDGIFLSKIEKLLEVGDPRLKEKHYDLILSDMAPSSSGHKFTDE